ncbi:MAG: DUF1294 domain-containing protein [Clostridia bacterium]|nr:DUF1294 domain-containing protein [Clostridia bacterium]
MKDYFLLALFAVNLFSFALCVFDKAAAKLGSRRISERTLLSVSALFGSYGMLAGMYIVRHKTKHAKFVITVPLFAVIHTVVLWYAVKLGYI